MHILKGVYWSKGSREGVNEDSLICLHVQIPRGESVLAAVCDGIGGLQSGEEASCIAVKHMADWFYDQWKVLIKEKASKEVILLSLQKQIYQIQDDLQKFQKAENIYMGTTFTMLLICRHRYFVVHIGDCRLYRIRCKKKVEKEKSKVHDKR